MNILEKLSPCLETQSSSPRRPTCMHWKGVQTPLLRGTLLICTIRTGSRVIVSTTRPELPMMALNSLAPPKNAAKNGKDYTHALSTFVYSDLSNKLYHYNNSHPALLGFLGSKIKSAF
mmetsp:Transcript_2739/g.4995  ORF Transcript_2739/g.4995 Transcript_2739/m.4995 type:complete len:118 (+) Transcript_2739:385-738(+)